jgi:diguanylate cyclase (GGDEF)-like protein
VRRLESQAQDADEGVQALRRQVEALRAEAAGLRRRLAEAEALADADALTPVLNRRAFLRELDRAIAWLRRYGGRACLLYFDLDGFKAANDRLGHAAGDVALIEVAVALKAKVRASDVVGRLGGDEFGVILAQTGARAGEAKARALAGVIANRSAAVRVPLVASWGVSEFGGEGAADGVLAAADAAMYAQKAAKRG